MYLSRLNFAHHISPQKNGGFKICQATNWITVMYLIHQPNDVSNIISLPNDRNTHPFKTTPNNILDFQPMALKVHLLCHPSSWHSQGAPVPHLSDFDSCQQRRKKRKTTGLAPLHFARLSPMTIMDLDDLSSPESGPPKIIQNYWRRLIL